jgi:hypothetical protein
MSVRMSDSISKLAPALASIAAEISDPTKDREVDMRLKTGGRVRYDYANLATALPALRATCARHGVTVVQSVSREAGVLETLLIHSSGEWVCTNYPIEVQRDPQAMGSQSTYARRYALFAALGVAAVEDDDDGVAGQAVVHGRKPDRRREPTDAKAARKSSHDPSWDEDRAKFMAKLSNLKYDLEFVEGFLTFVGARSTKPSEMTTPQRERLLGDLATDPRGDVGRYMEHLDLQTQGRDEDE